MMPGRRAPCSNSLSFWSFGGRSVCQVFLSSSPWWYGHPCGAFAGIRIPFVLHKGPCLLENVSTLLVSDTAQSSSR